MEYLGVDFGLKRVGLATSEGELASAWKIIEVKNFREALEKISQIIEQKGFEKVIIGLPEGKMGKNVAGFIKALTKRGFDVNTVDETLSSKKALETMIKLGLPRQRRQDVDAYSAAQILQDWLDAGGKGDTRIL
ncbi:hypothetical protein A3C26_02570 [Candidatus Daviesbacteria bacterium RIFCSPHIGHO2_02_FULL_39_12]|uniref:Putative pre-16S rRNA nuclease n=2 Tax=Candidatus Daviesiibacteriota TaxID=1752718 RepID=A0A1F5J9W8_9BACT|nr:MAG: hypothetical protein A3C26_02570 [Candidatus Daviesbacteria bacterium RIFCSPHIGHO2_02_FULL_39_12]OGE71494.1 MAG: hypothetical protein A3H40_03135 [Candidatus Daviesbacteria bacterium RIFCSPLOWO2_02_FULL_38_15]